MFKRILEIGVPILLLIVAIVVFSGGGPKLGNATASFVDAAGGFRVNGTTVIDTSGNFQQGVAGVAQFLGTFLVNDLIWAVNGYSLSVSTTTVLTAAQTCQTTHYHVVGSAALTTTTLAAATSTYSACNSPAFGSLSTQFLSNDSTNTANFVAGTGVVFRCPTNGVGTSTQSNNVACNGTQFSLLASSTVVNTGYWTASGTLNINVGPMYH